MAKLWGGRFSKNTNELVDAFNASISFDKRLYHEDIRGSMAHARMLAQCGIISKQDAQADCQRSAGYPEGYRGRQV
jgi:argininosuccinate lyase